MSTLPKVHPLYGLYRQGKSDSVFNPLNYCFDPARVAQIKGSGSARFLADMREPRDLRFRAAAAEFRKLSRRLRRSAVLQAGETVLTRFLDANYEQAGITENEACRAVLWAVGYCSAAHWQDSANGERKASRGTVPGAARSMSAHGDDPARIAMAIETASARYPNALRSATSGLSARVAIVGGGDEVQIVDESGSHVVPCPGGSAYLETSRMVATRTRMYWVLKDGAYRQVQRPGGWKMESVRAHRATEYPSGVARIVGDDHGRGVEYAG